MTNAVHRGQMFVWGAAGFCCLNALAVSLNYTAVDGDEVDIDRAQVQVDVPEGVNMTLLPGPYTATMRVQSGATAQIGVPQYDDATVTNAPWAGKVALWLDASAEWTLQAYGDKKGTVDGMSSAQWKGDKGG